MQSSIAPRTETARSKRPAIVAAAVDRFGQQGFEQTKWAAIADDVGLGQTALYHYFESKSHCLLTIMRMELGSSLDRFERVTAAVDAPAEALRLAVRSAYEGSPRDALQRRILQSHVALLGAARPSQKEEQERLLSRELVGHIEAAWTDLVRRGVEHGDFADRDANLSARMILALVVGVWQWYRPGGGYKLDEIGVAISEAALRVVRAPNNSSG